MLIFVLGCSTPLRINNLHKIINIVHLSCPILRFVIVCVCVWVGVSVCVWGGGVCGVCGVCVCARASISLRTKYTEASIRTAIFELFKEITWPNFYSTCIYL